MIAPPLKHWAKLALHSEYRELERIKNTPRYTHTSTDLLGSPLKLVDGLSFFYSYKEIFHQGIYSFKANKENPIIIDGGSNIGLSIIYFKSLYPASQILAFEADPKVCEVLKSNLLSFGYSDVQVNNKALWSSEALMEFLVEGADAGRIDNNKRERHIQEKIKVQAVPLYTYLDIPIDLLKLDIEGAETEVILSCAKLLHNVNNIFIEYHSFAGVEQRVNELLNVLKEAGFRVQLHTQFSSPQPLVSQPTYLGMDLQLNIFGYRE